MPSAWPNHHVWKLSKMDAPVWAYRNNDATSAAGMGAMTAALSRKRQAPSTVARFSVGANRRASSTASTISIMLATVKTALSR